MCETIQDGTTFKVIQAVAEKIVYVNIKLKFNYIIINDFNISTIL
jgi:hypothetical protein